MRWIVLAAAVAALAAPGCDQLDSMTKPKDAKEAPAQAAPPAKPTADQLGAPAGADVKAFYAGEFEGFGTEPDWKLDLLSNWASFTRPGLEEIGGLPTPPDVRAGGALIEAGPVSIILKAGACAHPSGEQLPYVMRVFYDGVTYDGCARRAAEGGAGANPTWAVTLPELIPAIDVCLGQVRGDNKRVTIAYTTEGTQVNVRILDGEGGRYECSVGEGAPTTVEALDDGDVLQGERDPLFTRAPGKPPAGSCYKSEDALAGDGKALGVVSKRVC